MIYWPVGHGLLQDVLGLVKAVGDGQDVDLAVLGHTGLNHGVYLGLVGRIGHAVGAVDALGLELGLQSLELLLVAAGHEHLGAGIAVSLGEDAGPERRWRRDQGDLALHGEHVVDELFFTLTISASSSYLLRVRDN